MLGVAIHRVHSPIFLSYLFWCNRAFLSSFARLDDSILSLLSLIFLDPDSSSVVVTKDVLEVCLCFLDLWRISAALPFEEAFVVFELISRVADCSNEVVAR